MRSLEVINSTVSFHSHLTQTKILLHLVILSRSLAELGTLCRFFSLGGRLSRIIFMALSGGSLKYGGSPSTISMTMMPRDQMSTCAGTL